MKFSLKPLVNSVFKLDNHRYGQLTGLGTQMSLYFDLSCKQRQVITLEFERFFQVSLRSDGIFITVSVSIGE